MENENSAGEAINTRCGYIAIVGRPNVGKSTLLNHLIGQKISITSRKPQTTRNAILGIKTVDNIQAIYVDTPGLHKPKSRAINRAMNKTATTALQDVDAIVFVVDRLRWTEEDQLVLEALKGRQSPVLLAINKVDQIEDKEKLLPHLKALADMFPFAELFPLSALKGHNIDALEQAIGRYLPLAPHLFPEDQVTDRSQRFMAAEIIREKIMRQLGDEVPYHVAVEIEEFKVQRRCWHISAVIFVEKAGQKAMIIGQQGSRLRLIGEEAREDMEKLFDNKVMLKLWIKVKHGWSDDERALQSLGYKDW